MSNFLIEHKIELGTGIRAEEEIWEIEAKKPFSLIRRQKNVREFTAIKVLLPLIRAQKMLFLIIKACWIFLASFSLLVKRKF